MIAAEIAGAAGYVAQGLGSVAEEVDAASAGGTRGPRGRGVGQWWAKALLMTDGLKCSSQTPHNS